MLILLLVPLALVSVQAKPHFNPCEPTPCGENSQCSINDRGAAGCQCRPGYFPRPNALLGCSPVCKKDNDCDTAHRCNNSQCVSSQCLSKQCGRRAECRVIDGQATCFCPAGLVGNPTLACSVDTRTADNVTRILRHTYCVDDRDCRADQACRSNHCSNPCEGIPCGHNAECSVRRHLPTCCCIDGYMGDPFVSCRPFNANNDRIEARNPCSLKGTCGENAECKAESGHASCKCPFGYHGDPNVRCIRSECTVNTDCPANQACHDFCCVNPCTGITCGRNAECIPKNRVATCCCLKGYVGNAFTACNPISYGDERFRPNNTNPCSIRSPCGTNAECSAIGGRASCSCRAGYSGDPYRSCSPAVRAECTHDGDCRADRACRNQRCVDPCLHSRITCGVNAQCLAQRHLPTCCCLDGYHGDPFEMCHDNSYASNARWMTKNLPWHSSLMMMYD